MKKTVQVLMLPTSKYTVGGIVAGKHGMVIMQANSVLDLQQQRVLSGTSPEWVGQHLYFTSNEEIKEGDYTICIPNPSSPEKTTEDWVQELNESRKFEKVIATTDKSLGLPLISQDLVEGYVLYNGTVKELEVELHENEYILFKPNKQTVEEAAAEWIGERAGNIYPNPFIQQDLEQLADFIINWYKRNG